MKITEAMIAVAAQLVGLTFTKAEREQMGQVLEQQLSLYEQLRAVPLPNHVAPALEFVPHRSAPTYLRLQRQSHWQYPYKPSTLRLILKRWHLLRSPCCTIRSAR